MTNRLWIDAETYSEEDIKAGAYRYAADPSTETMLVAWALNNEPVQLWDLTERSTIPTPLYMALSTTQGTFTPDEYHAWNANFEIENFRQRPIVHQGPRQLAKWRCDMAHAMSLSLPGSLDQAGEVVGIPQDQAKIKDGKRLIRLFCKPQKPTKARPWTRATRLTDPIDWAKFKVYCIRDVEANRAIWKKLNKFPMSRAEIALWQLDQEINGNGLPIDMALVHNAITMAEKEKAQLMNSSRRITMLKNPNSVQQLTGWLRDMGTVVPNLTKATVSSVLEDTNLPSKVRQVLVNRQESSKTSTAKYQAIANSVGQNGRLQGCFQFAGAQRTQRWAGRIFQPQNLPRGTLEPSDVETVTELIRQGDPHNMIPLIIGDTMSGLSSCLRSAVRAPHDKELIVADYSAIENRVLGWLADCEGINDVFANGLDPYKSFGVEFFGVDYDQITKEQRTVCKPAVLGCGFMLSGGMLRKLPDQRKIKTGLWGYAESMNIPLSLTAATESVALWRELYWEVPMYWDDLDKAMRKVIRHKTKTATVGEVVFDYKAPFLRIRLPSGRHLHYLRPAIEMRVPPWELDKKDPKRRETITYEGMDSNTHQWIRLSTHPGKITENIVQATARDILAHGLMAAKAFGFHLVGHVHDEAIALHSIGNGKYTLDALCQCLCSSIPWASTLLLEAAGFTAKAYRKD